MKYIWLVLIALIFTGCGYVPASQYTKKVVGDSVSTQMVISVQDPQNSVIIKDAVDTAIIIKFRTALKPKGEAKTHLTIYLSSVGLTPLQYDSNGYIITYRTTVSMRIIRTTDGKDKTYTSSGVYDFSIEPNAIVSEQTRFEAIKSGAEKALDSFIAQVAVEGLLNNPSTEK